MELLRDALEFGLPPGEHLGRLLALGDVPDHPDVAGLPAVVPQQLQGVDLGVKDLAGLAPQPELKEPVRPGRVAEDLAVDHREVGRIGVEKGRALPQHLVGLIAEDLEECGLVHVDDGS